MQKMRNSQKSKVSPKERLNLLPGLPVGCKLSGQTYEGVLIEEDALYDAWHVRLFSRPAGLDPSLNYHCLMIYTNHLVKPARQAVRVKVSGWRWECLHCGHENEEDTSTISVRKVRCSECGREYDGVLVDADDDILVEGCPFPE